MLRTLADLPDEELAGRRVLITADVDVARRQTIGESHFKISRLAETVRHLLERQSTVLVLGAQGGTSVRLLEPANAQGLEWHRQALIRALGDGWDVVRVDTITEALANPMRPGTVTLLPNLAELSLEDDSVFDNDADDDLQQQQACENALLPRILNVLYDVFVLDDFRSTVRALPSNVGLAAGKPHAVGLGLQHDLESLERLVARSRALGTSGRGNRICFIGSSRPEDALIAWSMLTDDLFDRVLLGPIPSLMVYRELGYSLGAGPSADLESLKSPHHSMAVRASTIAPRLASDFRDRIQPPTDFMVANRAGRGRTRRVIPEGLGDLAADDRIMSIGPETAKLFADETSRASLIFHFGMMSAGERPHVSFTESVIRTNLESDAEVYMAGDHILDIAHDIGLASALRGQSTGAQTASSLLSGVPVPGLVPFTKASVAATSARRLPPPRAGPLDPDPH